MPLRHVLLFLLIALTGCDKLTGAAAQKTSDAEAMGYACRVSLKKPEDCMKENDTQSTASILSGWKAADKDIQNKTLDPSMGSDSAQTVQLNPASAADATEVTKPKVEEAAAKKAPDQASDPDKKSKKSN